MLVLEQNTLKVASYPGSNFLPFITLKIRFMSSVVDKIRCSGGQPKVGHSLFSSFNICYQRYQAVQNIIISCCCSYMKSTKYLYIGKRTVVAKWTHTVPQKWLYCSHTQRCILYINIHTHTHTHTHTHCVYTVLFQFYVPNIDYFITCSLQEGKVILLQI